MSDSAIIWFENLGIADVSIVGGKNASLGEMVRKPAAVGVRVPQRFATTAAAFREFVGSIRLADPIRFELERYRDGRASLAEAGALIRSLFLESEFPAGIASPRSPEGLVQCDRSPPRGRAGTVSCVR